MENAYKRKKEPKQNRQIILDAAWEIGATTDWSQVTFQAISDRTGLSKGGIIHHFKNKEELLDVLIKQNLSNLTAFLQEYKKKEGATDNARAYLEFVLKNGSNQAYQKTMRLIVQAILVKEEYRLWWEDWLKTHILGDMTVAPDMQRMFFFLVAEGIWYTDSVGFSYLDENIRKGMLNYLHQL